MSRLTGTGRVSLARGRRVAFLQLQSCLVYMGLLSWLAYYRWAYILRTKALGIVGSWTV